MTPSADMLPPDIFRFTTPFLIIGLKQFLEDTTGEEIVANHSKMSFKNEVTKRWKADGTQKWGYEVTKAMCLATNRDLEISGVNPAPKFREAITKNDEDYIKEWIMGCHFEWLNPR